MSILTKLWFQNGSHNEFYVYFTIKKFFQKPVSFTLVQFSCSVMSGSLRPHGLQLARPPCPSPTPGVYSNSCPSSQWHHPNIPSSVVPFSSCPQSLPASGYFPMSQLFAWGGQSTGVSASASVLPMNTQSHYLSVRTWTVFRAERQSFQVSRHGVIVWEEFC